MTDTSLASPPALLGPGTGTPVSGLDEDLRRLNDLPVRVSAVVGRARLTIADLLRTGPGSVVELDRKAGAPVDILVNDRLVARGEITLVDGQLGVILTELLKDGD